MKLSKLVTLLSFLTVTSASGAEIGEPGPAALSQQGIAAYNKGDYQTAIKILTARSKQMPEAPEVYYYLGNCYLHLNQHDQAAHMYSHCIRRGAGTQAAEYSLHALESLSTRPRKEPDSKAVTPPDKALVEASADALLTSKPIDKHNNDALKRIKMERQTIKVLIDRVWEKLQEDIANLGSRRSPNYASDLEKISRQAAIDVERIQLRQQRKESRWLAPDKIDVRAIPEPPKGKPDNTKTALGSLTEYLNPDKPEDPLDAELSPEVAAKFLSLKDAFGEIESYHSASRRLAKQMFLQMKAAVENRQDHLDVDIHYAKEMLVRDVASIKANYGNQATYRNLSPSSFINSSKIPRRDPDSKTPMDVEIDQASQRCQKRIQELEDRYNKDVELIVCGTKERLGGLVVQPAGLNAQMKKPSGTIQVVPLGTDLNTRNYVNFGDRSMAPQVVPVSKPPVQSLRAQTGRLTPAAKITGKPK